jgi:molybdenum cofactor biosynthesis enzyme MoaA
VPVIEAGLSSIKFSVNAGSRETYALVHGHDDFDAVIENIRFISNYRRTYAPHLKMMASCVVTRAVEREKDLIKGILLPLVDDLVFFGVDSQSGQSSDQLVHLESTISPSVPEAGKAAPCAMLWNRVHVTCEGYLTLCCVDYENMLTYADLNTSVTLEDAWNNAVIVSMRQRHRSQALNGTLCQNCLYGTREPVVPLTMIGHASASVSEGAMSSRGGESVMIRIAKLAGKETGAS